MGWLKHSADEDNKVVILYFIVKTYFCCYYIAWTYPVQKSRGRNILYSKSAKIECQNYWLAKIENFFYMLWPTKIEDFFYRPILVGL